MRKKIILVGLFSTMLLLLCPTMVFAQYENIGWKERLGFKGDDKKDKNYDKNMEAQQVWTPFLRTNGTIAFEHPCDAQNPNAFDEYPRTWNDTCYRAWVRLIDKAPFSQFSLYASGGAGDMLRYLMHKEEDPAVKMIYFQDLIMLSDLRIKNLQAINSIPFNTVINGEKEMFGPQTKSSLADVKTWKAHYYYTEGKKIPSTGYNKELAYKYFVDAMTEVRNQKADGTSELEPYLIEEYFRACNELYMSNKDKYRVQYLTDYLDCSNTIQSLCEGAKRFENKEQASGEYFRWFNIIDQSIKPLFDMSFAGNPDSLDHYFKGKYDIYKDSIGYVNNAIELMMRNGCMPMAEKSRCIEKYAEIAYNNPSTLTYYGALAYGLKMNKDAADAGMMKDSVKRETCRIEMKKAFDKAVSLAKNNSEKAEVNYQIGMALNQKLDESLADILSFEEYDAEVERWKNDMEGVLAYLNNAIDLDPDHYAVAANFEMEMVHLRIANAYSSEKFFDPHTTEQRFSIRKDALQHANDAVTCCNEALREFTKTESNYVFTQGGTYVRQLAQNAELNGQNASRMAQSLQKSVSNYQKAYADADKKRKAAGANSAFEKWHISTYHPYLTKKGKEQAFFTGKGVICEYCHREFK